MFAQLKRKAEVRDTELTGMMLDGNLHRDILGTYFTYALDIVIAPGSVIAPGGMSAYDTLYEAMTTASASHTITVPYNQTTVTLTAYIQTVEDELYQDSASGATWHRLHVEFTSVGPVKVPT